MRKSLIMMFFLFLVVCVLNGEDISLPGNKLVVFEEWAFDLDHLELVEIEDSEDVNIVWDVNEEPRLWDQEILVIDEVNFPVYYSDNSILGYLTVERIVVDSNSAVSSQICLKIHPDGQDLWTYYPDSPLFYGYSLKVILHERNLYIAKYHPISSGSGVVCLDVKTGEEIWRGEDVELMISHSQYMNEVHIKLIDDKLVLVGDEMSARYIKVLNPLTGEELFFEVEYRARDF